MADLYDKRAVKILLSTYWKSSGWREDCSISDSDRKYAIEHGVMFEPVAFAHDTTLKGIAAMCDRITPEAVGSSFLASLSIRQPFLRSAMGSYGIARSRPQHIFSPVQNRKYCGQCSLAQEASPADLNVLSFERIKWGGVRHGGAAYDWFDLQLFLKESQPDPTPADVTLLRKTFQVIATLPPAATAGAYATAICSTFPSNLNERTVFIEILAYCGILAYPGYRDVFDNTVPPVDRPWRDTDWSIPAMYWRACDGVNEKRLREFFPSFADELLKHP